MIRTQQQLQLLFQKSREYNEKKKQRQQQLYKQASEQIRKELKKKQPITKTEPTEPLEYEVKLTIYRSTTIERYTPEENLYQTREELMNDKTGEINWKLWDFLVDKLRKTL